MKYSVYQINDKQGNKLGLITVQPFIDIIDITNRAKNEYGSDSDWMNPVYIGDIKI